MISPLRSLTPFSTSILDSRWKILCYILNATFLSSAIISVAIVAYFDPCNHGHFLSGIITLVAWLVIGLFPQLASIEIQKKQDTIYVNNIIIREKNTYISVDNSSSVNSESPTVSSLTDESTSVSKNKPSTEDLPHNSKESSMKECEDEPESPFSYQELEALFDDIISEYGDGTIDSSECLAIAKTLKNINDNAIGSYKFLKNNSQKKIIKWMVRKYPQKFRTTNISTLTNANGYDKYMNRWKKNLDIYNRETLSKCFERHKQHLS